MDCARARHLILADGELASTEVQRHMEQCPSCRSLFADGTDMARLLSGLQAAEPGAADTAFADMGKRLARERGWRSRLAELSSSARWAVAAAALAIPAVLGVFRHRHNLVLYPRGRLFAELAGLAVLVLASCWLWIRPLYKPQPSHRILWGVLGVALALPLALSFLPAALPGDAHAAAADLPTQLAHAASCFIYGSATAMPALLLVAGLGRRRAGFPGFALLPAMAAALAGIFGLELHCPDASPSHLAMGHASIVWVLALLLSLAGLRQRRSWKERQAQR